MIGTVALERSARELMHRAADRTRQVAGRPGRPAMRAADAADKQGRARKRKLGLDIATVEWMMPHLVQMVDDLHDAPIERIAPAVRRLLMEQVFCEGDVVMTADQREELDRQVRLIVRLLAHARRRSRQDRRWSQLPLTPQMFG